MGPIRSFLRFIIRLIVVWFVDTISLLVTAWIITGISFQEVYGLPVFVVATTAALLLGLINLLNGADAFDPGWMGYELPPTSATCPQ